MGGKSVVRPIKRGLIALGAIIAIIGAGGAFFVIRENLRIAELDKTHSGPLTFEAHDTVSRALFTSLGPPAADSLHFIATPFRGSWFAVAISVDSGRGKGQIVIYDRKDGQSERRDFSMPAADANRFLDEWDRISDPYSGSSSIWLDGNGLAFERHRGPRTTSGQGNNPCHYEKLAQVAARHLSLYVPDLAALQFRGTDPHAC